jgi:glyoxylase-like metal-dependent hydrolase (beta-lactamase superfamily II)
MSELVPIIDNLYMIDAPFFGVPLYLYVITGGDQVALIDSGINTTPDQFIFPALRKAGLKPDLLINTHGHVDHFGGNGRVRQEYPDIKIAIHAIDAPWIEDHVRHMHEMYYMMPADWMFEDGGKGFLDLCGENTAVDIFLQDEQTFQVGPFNFRVIRSDGHSPGHVILHDAAKKVAICGDVALGKGPKVHPGTQDAPSIYLGPDKYLAGVELLRGLKADTYCTGHFGVQDFNGMNQLCDLTHEFVNDIDRWSLEALSQTEPRSLHTIATYVWKHMPSYEFGYHIHGSTLGHLMRHVTQGRARAVMINGHKHYLAV